jgi:hypothetical protein
MNTDDEIFCASRMDSILERVGHEVLENLVAKAQEMSSRCLNIGYTDC